MKLKLFQKGRSGSDNRTPAQSAPSPNDSTAVQGKTNDRKGLFQRRRNAKQSDNKAPAHVASSIPNAPATILSVPAAVHEYVLTNFLEPADWSRLSKVCRTLRAPYSNRIATYKETKMGEVSATRLIPLAIFNDPLFIKFPPNYQLLAKTLNRAGPIIKMMLGKGVKAWQVAAFLGMDGALHAMYGDGIRDLKDGHGYTVEHYYMVTNDRMLVRSHFTRYKPFFKAMTHEDYGFAEIAAAAGSVDILDMFRKSYGFDLNRLNTELDITVIHCATQFGQGGTVRWLVEQAGVDPRVGRTVTLVAAEHGRLSLYNYFIRMGIYAKNAAENNELMVHIAHCDAADLIETWIEKNGVEIMRSISHDGNTIFCSAVRGGQYDTFMLCVRRGLGKVDHRWHKNWTHLHLAAFEGRFTFIRRLLQEFPDLLNPYMVDDDNRTMLFFAAAFGEYDDFSDLVTHCHYTDEDCLRQDINGMSIAHMACKSGKLAFLIQFTIKFGTECLRQTDHRGLTTLHYACLGHNLDLIEWLVTVHRLSFATKDSSGKTPLHYLAEKALANPSLCLWEDLPSIAEKFGIEYVTDYQDSSGHTVKDYLETVDTQSKVFDEIKLMCYPKKGFH